MCGRYYRRSDKQKIAEAFSLGELPAGLVLPDWNYSVAPTTFQPVIRNNRQTGGRELTLMRWGLVPSFAKSPKEFKALSTINAKGETVQTSALWRTSFERRRCLVPADGFYEWPKTSSGAKQPRAFMLKDCEPFAFAGLWDVWKEPKMSPQTVDTWLQSYTIITTTPNELTATVHDRMPVILEPKNYDRWLSRGDEERPPVDLLRPFPAEEMTSHEAHKDVGNVRNNHREFLNSA